MKYMKHWIHIQGPTSADLRELWDDAANAAVLVAVVVANIALVLRLAA